MRGIVAWRPPIVPLGGTRNLHLNSWNFRFSSQRPHTIYPSTDGLSVSCVTHRGIPAHFFFFGLGWIIHELGDVILSEATAKNFRPASFVTRHPIARKCGARWGPRVGRARGSKDPYCRKLPRASARLKAALTEWCRPYGTPIPISRSPSTEVLG